MSLTSGYKLRVQTGKVTHLHGQRLRSAPQPFGHLDYQRIAAVDLAKRHLAIQVKSYD
jgi:hypothetical protein